MRWGNAGVVAGGRLRKRRGEKLRRALGGNAIGDGDGRRPVVVKWELRKTMECEGMSGLGWEAAGENSMMVYGVS